MQEGAERADNEGSLPGVAGGIPALPSGSRPRTGTDGGGSSAPRVLPRQRPPPASPEQRSGAGPGFGRARSDPRGAGGIEAAPHPPGSERRRCPRCRRSEIHQNEI